MEHRTPKTPRRIKGRGTTENPESRFVSYYSERGECDEFAEEFAVRPETRLLKDSSKTILTENTSPDVGFNTSINVYRGCEHGCIYCYARPTHEYLEFSAGLEFETRILVKEKAPALLRQELAQKSWKPRTVVLSGVTDPYQPIERHLKLTRRCLSVLLEFQNPVAIITKNSLITRDLDLLTQFARFRGVGVYLSITSLDTHLCGVLEPRTARPTKRLETISALAKEGVPVGVNVAPVIPGLTDHEMPKILEAAYAAGARAAGYVPLRLPYGIENLFENWLETHFPERKQKILSRIQSLRGGKLNDASFGSRMRGEGVFADQIENVFRVWTKRLGYNQRDFDLSTQAFRRPVQAGEQLFLFEENKL